MNDDKQETKNNENKSKENKKCFFGHKIIPFSSIFASLCLIISSSFDKI